MNTKGFTLMEIVVVTGITVTLFAFGLSAFSSFERSLKKDMHQETISLLTEAARKARAGVHGSSWGVYFDINEETNILQSMTLFSGDTYETRNTSHDSRVFSSPPIEIEEFSITDIPTHISNGYEIVFQKERGTPFQTGTILLHSNDSRSTIEINSSGFPQLER